MRFPLTFVLALTAALASAIACASIPSHAQSTETEGAATVTTATASSESQAQADATANPFFSVSPLPLHYPRFDKIKDSDFAPAFDRGMAEHLKEVKAIASNPAAPTFENTIVALEKSGQILGRTATVFFSLVGADTNDTRKALEAEYAPKLAAHRDAIMLNPKLFPRVDKLYETRDALELTPAEVRLIEQYHEDFVRAGAKLSDADKTRMKAINAELAKLGTKFSQNVLAEVNDSAVVVDDAAKLAGLTEQQIAAAAEEAKARDLDGTYVLTLQNTTQQPITTYLDNRELRKRIYEASLARGSRGNQWDNREIVSKVMALRVEKANLLGYPTYAAYVLADETAKTPEAVNKMLAKLAPPAVANAKQEAAVLQAMIDKTQAAKDEPTFKLQPWDWAYYAEKVRQQEFDFDAAELKPYLALDSVYKNGVFYAANQLYGLTFKERDDLPVYQEDVRTFDVFDKNGEQLAIFILDPYARDSKNGGAWMNAYVSQSTLMDRMPVVANHLNIVEPPEGEPTLLTWDEVTTAFHEFGHALHGMFSDVKYPYFSGTSVPRDFVEYPSQVNEMWADWPSVLANYAKHYKTGEPIPQALLDKVLASSKFNQGFATTEYLAAAMLDQSWHQLSADEIPQADEVLDFEAKALTKNGTDFYAVPPRYRTPYFSHIMGGYAAGYYAYIWSEVLDANTVEWLKHHGGLTRDNGDRFRAKLLSQGGSKDALELFRDFAGHKPRIEPLLERRGLTTTVVDDAETPAETGKSGASEPAATDG